MVPDEWGSDGRWQGGVGEKPKVVGEKHSSGGAGSRAGWGGHGVHFIAILYNSYLWYRQTLICIDYYVIKMEKSETSAWT